jgi:DNA-directed RNA polymerase subunit omega
MEKLPEGIDSTFRYILIAAKRAEQLIGGARARLTSRHAKPATIALEELGIGKVPWQPLTAEEYDLMRERDLREQTSEEEVVLAVPVPRPIVPLLAEAETGTEEETEEFADDIEDPEFEDDLGDLEAPPPELLEDTEG